MERPSQRREQWRLLEQQWRDKLHKVNGNGVGNGTWEVHTRDELETALKRFRIDDTSHEFHDGQPLLSEVLSDAVDKFAPFARIVEHASQPSQVSGLLWAGVLSVIQVTTSFPTVSLTNAMTSKVASQSYVVDHTVAELVIRLSDAMPSLDLCNRSMYRNRTVQDALRDIFDDFLEYCTDACAYYSPQPGHKTDSGLAGIFPREPRSSLPPDVSSIKDNVERLRTATSEIRRHQEAAGGYAGLLPKGISDLPPPKDNSRNGPKVSFPVTTIERAHNKAFVGREDILGELSNQTCQTRRGRKASACDSKAVASTGSGAPTTPPPAPTVCVLHGLAGMGKTELALQYYYRHRDEYDAHFWIEAEHEWTLASTFAKIADKLELLPKKTTDDGGNEVQRQAIDEARTWLQTTEHRWLLIFDNVEEFDDLGRYWPAQNRCGGVILVTTQSPVFPAWMDDSHTMPVKELDPKTAATCMFNYLGRQHEDEDEYDVGQRLAEHVGCMPLAMATIGGFVKQSQMKLAEFFEDLKTRSTLWVKATKVQRAQGLSRSLINVFEKAFEEISPASRELLNVLAFLDPDSVPESIFDEAIDRQLFQHISSKKELLACYFELRGRQLVHRDTLSTHHFLYTHRLVQWSILLELSKDPNERWACFKQAFDMVKAVLPEKNPLQTPEADDWPHYARHGRQILELRSHCLWPEPPVPLPRSFAEILIEMGTYMWFSGKFPEGEEALRTAENILDDTCAKHGDALRTNVYTMLGVITSYEGVSQRERSLNLRRDAYQSRRQEQSMKKNKDRTREDDIMLWNMHSDMAYGFIQHEDFQTTAEYIGECLEQYKKWDETEEAIPFEYSKYYWLIAYCHMDDQRPWDAMESITRCYQLIQMAAGGEHPISQLVKFCYANLLWHTGKEEVRPEVLKINKAVLAFRRRLLGEFSQFTMESYSTCGKLCHEAGEVEEAQQHLETCLQRRKRAAWNEEGVTRAQFRYAKVLRALAEKASDPQRAQELSNDARAREDEVARVIERYRRDYKEYMPAGEGQEENLDQMVSIWAGRFTGGLKLSSTVDIMSEDIDNPGESQSEGLSSP